MYKDTVRRKNLKECKSRRTRGLIVCVQQGQSQQSNKMCVGEIRVFMPEVQEKLAIGVGRLAGRGAVSH